MSYILDALKKSEQERGHGNVPGVQTVHSSSLNYSNKKVYWPYILIVAVVLNLAAIIYFVIDRKSEQQKSIVSSETNTVNTTHTRPGPVDTSQTPSSTEAAPQVYEPASQSNNSTGNNRPEITTSSSRQQAAVIHEKAGPPAERNTAATTQDRTDIKTVPPVADKEVMEFHELPESIKQQLPAIIISAHVYSSNPTQRSIVVNNNFLEEGEYVLDGLVLHEITPDGAIFNYYETLFHLGVVSGWQ